MRILRPGSPVRAFVAETGTPPGDLVLLPIDDVEINGAVAHLAESEIVADAVSALLGARQEILNRLEAQFPDGYCVDSDLVLRYVTCPACDQPVTNYENVEGHGAMVRTVPCEHMMLPSVLAEHAHVLGSLGMWRTFTTLERATYTIEFVPHRDAHGGATVVGISNPAGEDWAREFMGNWTVPNADPMRDLQEWANIYRERNGVEADIVEDRHGRRWTNWRDFADDDSFNRPPLEAYTAPPPDFHTVPRETPMGEIGYAPSIVEDVESCWRCTTGAVVEEDLGLCSDCITTLREANE